MFQGNANLLRVVEDEPFDTSEREGVVRVGENTAAMLHQAHGLTIATMEGKLAIPESVIKGLVAYIQDKDNLRMLVRSVNTLMEVPQNILFTNWAYIFNIVLHTHSKVVWDVCICIHLISRYTFVYVQDAPRRLTHTD